MDTPLHIVNKDGKLVEALTVLHDTDGTDYTLISDHICLEVYNSVVEEVEEGNK